MFEGCIGEHWTPKCPSRILETKKWMRLGGSYNRDVTLIFQHEVRGYASLALLLLNAAAGVVHADDWLPVPAEQLQMSSEPRAPKAAAIYLYRQIDRDDADHREKVYVRVKILTDEGRRYANVAIPYEKGREQVMNIEARTIRPDGSVVNFDGTVYDNMAVESKDRRLMTKTFTLDDVQAGSIIEYRYKHTLSYGYVVDSHWIVSADLYTQRAEFSLVPNGYYTLRTTAPAGLPPGTEFPKPVRGVIRMSVTDVPAFVSEEYMPPEDQLKMRVDFVYLSDSVIDKDAATFWKRVDKASYKKVARFVDEPRAMRDAVSSLVSAADSREEKLRKLYAAAQSIRNLSFESVHDERENSKDNENVADVLKNRYGDRYQITWLFLALARAAGFEADPVFLSNRGRYFFDPEMRDPSKLAGAIVIVKLDGREIYLDCGVPFAPFGALPWGETAAHGLRLDKDGGTWITTPVPVYSASRIDREATLVLTPDGSLQGTATFTFSGLEALTRRLIVGQEDDIARKKALENEVKAEISSGSEVTLTNTPHWGGAEDTLVAQFNVTIPEWAQMAGRRALVPTSVFVGTSKHVFEHGVRIHPVYFHYPHQVKDDIHVELPSDWQLKSVPAAEHADIKIASYDWSAQSSGNSLHLQRQLTINTLLVEAKFYGNLQGFYQSVRSIDDGQAIFSLPPGTARP